MGIEAAGNLAADVRDSLLKSAVCEVSKLLIGIISFTVLGFVCYVVI